MQKIEKYKKDFEKDLNAKDLTFAKSGGESVNFDGHQVKVTFEK